jgi:acyl transferase domain-containing protein/SAM-dependent methyltransferase/acyl carrier protein
MEIQPDNADRRLVLNQALNALEEMQGRLNEAERSKTEPIAVIGMGCRFPGGADTPEAFWQLLRNGGNAVREVPADRWDVSGYFDPDPEAPGKIYTRFGGFLDQVDKFDSQFFGISPREALSLDPQQRLVLEVGWEALERAGQSPAELLDSRTAVFIGIGSSDYFLLQTKNSDPARIDAYTGSGGGLCFAAGRLSYFLGLQGPSMIIDTACSSSLVAVHQACQSLRTRESNLALAGGVNLMLSPDLFIYLCKIKALAADGFCKAFDAAADGLVRGEGCGVVVLKRLADAVSDGDNILALIAGSAVNQDGRSSGLTVPNGVAQQALIREALANARKEPAQVSFVETHGTGTSLGDPIEANALGAVLGMGRRKDQPLVIGSVKTNVGHLEAAAGIAGLIKAVLALQHKEIPPNLHFKHLNPEINVNEFPILVPTKAIPWTSASGTRIAGVSSFGLSGTNAHVILEEAPSRAPLSAGDSRPTHVLCLSAKNPAALKQLSARYEDYLATQPMTPVSDVCYTANTGRAHFKHRLAIVNSSLEELRARLLDFGAGNESVCVSSGEVKGILPPKVAFLFTGQGGQYVNMGRALDESEPAFRQIVDRCDELLRPHLPKSLRSVLYPQPGEITPLDETAYTHVAMFAVQYGLAQLWRSWGVQPGMVMGHSVGEIVAATVAGSMSLEDGLMIMRERGRLMQSLPATGMMASLLAGEERVAAALAPYRDRVAIAAVNGPESTVISGERTAMQEILHTLEAEGIKTKPLKVSNSFHSPLVEPVLEEFEHAAARAAFRPPQMALFSSMRLEMVGERNLLDAAYWRYNLRHTVRFSEAMRAVYEQGYRMFLEIGPSPILVSMGSQCVPEGQGVWLPSLRQDRNDWDQVLESLGTLYVNGVNIDWSGFDRHHARKKIMLPTYPWRRKQFWVEAARTRQLGSSSQVTSRWQQVVSTAREQSRQVPIDLALDGYPAKWKILDQLTTAHVVHTLRALGAFRTANQKHSLDSLLQECKILPTYRILISRWLKKLAAEGLLQEIGDEYGSPAPLSEDLLSPARRLAGTELSDIPFVLEYMDRCGQMAPFILKGEATPLDTLFQGGSLALAEDIYEHWALSRYYNNIARSAIESLVRTLPHGRQLRIVEIGAGTGGSTSALLPVLPPNRTLYCFTDVSKLFFDRARDKYKEYPFIRFGLLDIEKNPEEQGFGEHGFDAVIASNVLHATRNLDETIENVLRLQGPGALLLLCEVTNPPSWIEFSYGLIEDWHRFNDGLRQDSPLLAREQWETLLRSHGYEEVVAFPESGSPAEILGVHCIVARAPSSGYSLQREGRDTGMEDLSRPSSMDLIEVESVEALGGRLEDFLRVLRQSPPSEQREQLVEFVRSRTMKVLRRDRSDPIDRRHRLMDLGIDSLMAVELRNALSTELGLPHVLPATLIFDYPNVEAIADYLASRVLTLDLVSSQPLSPKSGKAAEISPLVTGRKEERAEAIQAVMKIEDLSDEEVEKLLLKKLETI